MRRVAVIGAGLSGVVLARQLVGRAEVELFEKSRGPSGRLATRRVDGGFEFDHGAQFFTARHASFQLFLQPYLQSGVVQEWKPRVLTFSPGQAPYKRDWFEPHYVAVPSMTSLVKDLAKGLSINLHHEIDEVLSDASGWHLKTRDSRLVGPFDWVVSTCPADQTQALLPTNFAQIGQVKLQACFALMLGFDATPKVGWQAAVFRDSCLNWASWNNSKPGRSERPALAVLSDSDWADQQLESDLDNVKASMEVELEALTGLDPKTANVSQLHRWRFAKVTHPAGQPYLMDIDRQLATCGDWCLGDRVESAFLSATGLANRLHEIMARCDG